jgi:uncharacterized protein YndB with AHSA1/START domain
MSDYGVVSEPRTVRFERVLPGPIDRVWAYLTESDKPAKWLASGPMELRVGGRFELKFNQADYAAIIEPTPERFKHHGGEVEIGLITQCDPPRLLAFTWREGPVESEVIFRADAPRPRRATRPDPSPTRQSRRDGQCRQRLAYAAGDPRRASERMRAAMDMASAGRGGRRVREAHPARLIFV